MTSEKMMKHLTTLIKMRVNDRARDILQSVALHDYVDDSGATLLHIAAAAGNEVILKDLLDMGVDVNARDKRKNTAMALAIRNEHYSIVSIILQYKPNIRLKDRYKRNALDIMLESGDNSMNVFNILTLLQLHEGLLIKTKETTIYNAICLNNAEIMRLLLKNNFSINNQLIESGETALHVAFHMNKLEVALVLLENNADVNVTCSFGKIPVAYKDKFDDSDLELNVMKMVFLRAENLTTLDNKGEMQIMQLLRNGRKKVMKALLQSESLDFMAKDANDTTILHFLAENYYLFNERSFFKVLCGKNFDIDAVDGNGETALSLAAFYGNFALLEFLLHNNAKSKECLLLHCIYETEGKRETRINDYLKCAEIILDHGAFDLQMELSKSKWPKTLILQLTRDTVGKTILELSSNLDNLALINLILAYLAIMESQKKTINHFTYALIDSNNIWREQFNSCRCDLLLFQMTKLDDSCSLYDLMWMPEEELTFILKAEDCFKKLINLDKKYISKSKYHTIFWHRLKKPFRSVKAKNNAVALICEIMGVCYIRKAIVVNKIIGYFWSDEAESLFLESEV